MTSFKHLVLSNCFSLMHLAAYFISFNLLSFSYLFSMGSASVKLLKQLYQSILDASLT